MLRNCFTAALLLVLCSCCASWCQEKNDSRVEAGKRVEKRIRKLLVPEADIDEFIEQRRGYAPMNRLDFEKLLAEHQNQARLNRPAFVARTVISGNLDASGELSGEAFLYIENPAELTELTSLSGFNLFLFDAQWLDEAAVRQLEAAGYQASATVEKTGQADTDIAEESASDGLDRSAVAGDDGDGNLRVLVHKTGVLKLRWKHPGSLHTEKNPGRLSFPFMLPPAVNARIYLTLPDRYALSAADCRVELVAAEVESNKASDGNLPAEQAWSINCGVKPEVQIDLLDRTLKTEPPDQTMFDETLSYSVQPTGIEFESLISLANVKSTESGLRIKLPREVVCQGIEIQGEDAAYSVERTDGEMLITLNLPATTLAADQIRFLGYAPLHPGQTTRFPKLQLENLSWRRSEINVLISSMLAVQELNHTGVVLNAIGNTQAADGDRNYDFQAFDQDFHFEIVCHPRVASLSVTSICKADIGLESIEASQTSILRSPTGFIFSIEADYPAYWIIDSVSAEDTAEAANAEKLVSYWESRDTNTDAAKKLFVQFARPIDAAHALAVNVKGHRTFSSNVEASLEEFNILSFDSVIGKGEKYAKTVALNNKAKTRLTLKEGNALLERVSLNKLDPLLVEHGSVTVRDLILPLNQPASRAARVVTERESQQQFDADVLVTGFIAKNQVREQFRIDCRPVATEVSRLEISLFGSEAQIQWSLDDATNGRLITRPLESRDVETSGGVIKEQIWEIEFRPALSEPFALIGSLPSDRQASHSMKRLNVRNASNQSQRVLVGTVNGARAEVEVGDFESVPWEPSERALFSELLGAYRPISANYAPLVIKVPAMDPVVSAWVEHLHVDYRFDSQASETVAQFFLKNHGLDSFVFRLPLDSVLQSVHVAGVLAEFTKRGDNEYSCSLPAGQESPLLTMLFTSNQGPAGLSKSMPLPTPDVDLPILDMRQTIFLADGWALADNWQPIGYRATLWEEMRDRFFGGLTTFVFSKAAAQPWPTSAAFAPDSYNQHLQFGSDDTTRDQRGHLALTYAGRRSGFSGDDRVVDLADAFPSQYRLVNVKWLELGRWLALLASFCLALSVAKRRRKLLLFVAVFAGAICLVVPLAFAPLFAAIFWGIVLSLLLLSLKIGEPAVNRNTMLPDVQTISRREGLTVGLLFLACFLLFRQNHVLATEKPDAAAPRIVYYDVILPIDKDDQVSGEFVYVPGELYSSMITDKSLNKSQTLPVMFNSAEYLCEMQANEQGSEISVKEITATINFRTSRNLTSVLIPIDTSSILLTRDSVRLDAIKVSVRLPDTGNGFFVEADRPGLHKLSFRFLLPKTNENQGWRELNLTVPRIHASSLTISVPRQINWLDVHSDVCVLRQDRSIRNYQGSFGPAGRLAFRWPRQIPLDKEPSVTLVDQLLKTEFTRDGAEYEYLWLFKNREPSSTDVLEIEMDGGLELIEPESSRALLKKSIGIKRNRFVFEATQNKDVLFVTAKFREGDKSVLGNHYLPRVTIPSARIDANLASLAADESLELKVLGDPSDILADSVNTFVQLWSRARIADHANVSRVVRIDDARARWALAILPRATEFEAESALQLAIDADRATVAATIDLKTLKGALSFVEFALPEGFTIDAVHVDGIEDQQILSLIELNRCQLIVDAQGHNLLSIRIEGICEFQDQFPFPTLQVLNCQQHVRQVSIARSHDLDATISPPAGFESAVEQSAVGVDRWSQRFESNWIGRGEIPLEGQVLVQRAVLADRGLLVTTLKKEGPEFVVDFDCLIQGAEGARLDTIQLNVSEAVTEILSASVPGKFRLVELPLAARKRIEFVPDQALVPYSRLIIRVKISQRRSLPPNVFWTNLADDESCFVRLPKVVDGREVEWSIDELANIKSEVLLKQVEKLPAAKSYENFQVSRSDYRAVMESNTAEKRELEIPLQVTSITWSGREYLIGTCEFELSPADPVSLYLNHRPTISVMHATVDTLPVEFMAADGFCRVELPGSRYPRRLSITFQARIFTHHHGANFEFGLLIPRDRVVGMHLFQISLPTSRRNLFSPSLVEGIPASDFGISRLESLAELVNTLPIQSSDESERDRSNWMAGWRARMTSITRQVEAASLGTDQRIRFEEIKEKFDLPVKNLPSDAARLSNTPAEISPASLASSLHGQYTVWHGIINDQTESVRLSFDQPPHARMRLPSQISIAIALLIGCLVVLLTPVWSWLARIAHPIALAATFLLGASWTFFFTPAFVGWLIAFAAICVGLRSLFSSRRQRKVAVRDDALLASQ